MEISPVSNQASKWQTTSKPASSDNTQSRTSTDTVTFSPEALAALGIKPGQEIPPLIEYKPEGFQVSYPVETVEKNLQAIQERLRTELGHDAGTFEVGFDEKTASLKVFGNDQVAGKLDALLNSDNLVDGRNTLRKLFDQTAGFTSMLLRSNNFGARLTGITAPKEIDVPGYAGHTEGTLGSFDVSMFRLSYEAGQLSSRFFEADIDR